jgi:hypothetical protein
MNKPKSSNRGRVQGPQSILKHLAASQSGLSRLQQQAFAIHAIKATLWPSIPSPLQAHCDVANFRGQTLILVADSPVWAARLRHTSPQILHAARELCKIDAQKLLVRIQPLEVRPQPVGKARSLPESSATHLREVAETVEDDELREILLGIANREPETR